MLFSCKPVVIGLGQKVRSSFSLAGSVSVPEDTWGERTSAITV